MLKKLKIILFLLILLLSIRYNILRAQETEDTTSFNLVKERHYLDSADTYIFKFNNYANYDFLKLNYPITDFNQHRIFYPYGTDHVSLGNNGQALQGLLFKSELSNNVQVRPDVLALYRLLPDSINFIRCERPYSEASYMLGKQKEQRLDFTFNQKLGKYIYAGLRTRFGNAPGVYLHQRSYWAGAYFTLQYLSSDNRYNANLAYLTDRFTNSENGGIKYDSVFEKNIEDNRRTILVNLDKAVNRDKGHGIQFQHYYRLNSAKKHSDSLLDLKYTPGGNGKIVHTFSYYRNTEVFDDKSTDKSIYPVTYFSNKKSYDSLSRYYVNNTIALTNIESDTSEFSRLLQYAIGFEYKYDNLYFFNTDSIINELSYSAVKGFSTFLLNLKEIGQISATGSITQNGYYHNDFFLKANYNTIIQSQKFHAAFKGSFQIQQRTPDLIYSNYSTNHFRSDYSLYKTDSKILEGNLYLNGFNLSINYHIIRNYTFLDNTLNVQQYSDILDILQIKAVKTMNLKHLNSYIGLDYQAVNNSDIIALPKIVAKGKLAFTSWLFNKSLQLETGIAAFYYTSYYADEYMPSIRMFFRQSSKKYGNHLYADAFVNLKIKRMRMFISYKHFNASFTGYNYMAVPHYPQPDAGVEFGINWVFFD